MSDNRILDELLCDGTVTLRKIEREPENPMKFEQNRLESFDSWPDNAPIEAKKLAKAGFYYEGTGITVKCFSCNGIIDEWDYGDQAIRKHTNLNSNCDFVLQKSDNIPIRGPNREEFFSINPTTSNPSLSSTTRSLNLHLPLSSATETAKKLDKTWDSIEHLSQEEERLRTFKNWSCTFVKPKDLAQNGFFSLRSGDKVQCFFCRGILGDWEDGDVPAVEHKRHFRRCRFLCGFKVGNVPLQRSPEDEGIDIPKTPSDDDETGKYINEMDELSQEEKLSILGIIKHCEPKHKNYVTFESRLKSFQNWPYSAPQYQHKLAEAGLFYAGALDYVRCFCCDGGLRNWEPEDDPWIEHARWFGRCYFLNLIKKPEFAENAQIQHPPILSMEANCSESNNEFLFDQNRKLTEALICKVCMDDKVSVVFLPCGHLVTCYKCAPSLSDCPMCRKKINNTLRAYI